MGFMIRIVAASVCLLVCVWLSALNAGVFWKAHVRQEPAPSWIPLLGGGCGVFGLLLLPYEAAQRWWWVPLILDWGSLPGIGHALLFHLFRRRRS